MLSWDEFQILSDMHPSTSILKGQKIVLRPLVREDAHRMVELANNYNIWRTVSDGFPNPFGISDAYARIETASATNPIRTFAMALEEGLVGWITLKAKGDVQRVNAEIGYWLGEPYWGRGYTKEAIRLITEYGFSVLGHSRIFGLVLSTNQPSANALKSNGFELESIQRWGAMKEGVLYDQWVLAKYHPELVVRAKDCLPWPEPKGL
ncbi:MAG TPA: GNAT family N-acetyltransferase [Cytophagales bacterium]|nr:GNAT family N-acetyltransferase [Cytophagales bacterium]HAA21169.1 GNAT family N-acetyltransferase [Cytophagales bacterium]HAP60689.1 GNAT family N-acetyltransferase [Cytophagales bacterium]